MAAAHSSRPFVPSPQREADLGSAALRVYEAGQTLVVRRLELWVAEARGSAHLAGVLLFAAVLGIFGWVHLVAGAIDGLARDYPRFAVELSVGAFHLGAAGTVVALVRRATAKRGVRA